MSKWIWFAMIAAVLFAIVGAAMGDDAATIGWALIALGWTFNTHLAVKRAQLELELARAWRRECGNYRKAFTAANRSAEAWRDYALILEASRQTAGEDKPSQGGTE